MNGSEAGSGSPSGGSSPGAGGSSRRPRGVVAAVVVLVALLVIGIAVVIGLRLGGNYLGEQTSTGPFQTSTKATTTRTSRKSRTSTPTTTTTARRTAQCDARTINTDLGYPDSGSRIIDCGGGWAVMASEHSGDPYWVVYRNGRWQTRRDVSMYLMTCPDEAIAKGAPAWMANKHLGNCPELNPTTRERETTRSRPRSTTPSPSVAPSPRPSPSVAPTVSPSSSPSTTSPTVPTETTEVTTTTHTGDAPADMEDTE